MTKRLLLSGAVVLLAVGVAVVSLAPWQDDPGVPQDVVIDWRDDALVAEGGALYAANCASCHGAALEGEANWQIRGEDGLLPAPPHDETGHTWHHPDAVLFALTKFGPASMAGDDYVSTMPAYANILTDAQITAVLAFIKRQWPSDIQDRHDQVNAAYRAQR